MLCKVFCVILSCRPLIAPLYLGPNMPDDVPMRPAMAAVFIVFDVFRLGVLLCDVF